MKAIKMIFRVIFEPFNYIISRKIIEGVVNLMKKAPIIVFILSAIITALLAYFYIF